MNLYYETNPIQTIALLTQVWLTVQLGQPFYHITTFSIYYSIRIDNDPSWNNPILFSRDLKCEKKKKKKPEIAYYIGNCTSKYTE